MVREREWLEHDGALLAHHNTWLPPWKAESQAYALAAP
jgi:hypothetical protein